MQLCIIMVIIVIIFGTALPASALGCWPRARCGQGMLLRGSKRGASHVWVGAAAPGTPGPPAAPNPARPSPCFAPVSPEPCGAVGGDARLRLCAARDCVCFRDAGLVLCLIIRGAGGTTHLPSPRGEPRCSCPAGGGTQGGKAGPGCAGRGRCAPHGEPRQLHYPQLHREQVTMETPESEASPGPESQHIRVLKCRPQACGGESWLRARGGRSAGAARAVGQDFGGVAGAGLCPNRATVGPEGCSATRCSCIHPCAIPC